MGELIVPYLVDHLPITLTATQTIHWLPSRVHFKLITRSMPTKRRARPSTSWHGKLEALVQPSHPLLWLHPVVTYNNRRMLWMLQIAISLPTSSSAVSELILDKEATTMAKALAIWTKQVISKRRISSWCRLSSTPSSTWVVDSNKPYPLPTLRSANLSSSSRACWAAETGAQTRLESEHTLIWKTSIRNQLE